MSTGDISALPDDLSTASTPQSTPAKATGLNAPTRMPRNRAICGTSAVRRRGFAFCSAGSVYGYQSQRLLREPDLPDALLRAKYNFSRSQLRRCAPGSPSLTEYRSRSPASARPWPEGGAPAERLGLTSADARASARRNEVGRDRGCCHHAAPECLCAGEGSAVGDGRERLPLEGTCRSAELMCDGTDVVVQLRRPGVAP
jgi:hypothetical protein